MARYAAEGIRYFNPQVDDWKPELAAEEARHLAEDAVILFPVTKETYGLGSLSETGFSILNAIRMDSRRDFVVYIEADLAPELTENAALAKESMRARKLVSAHLRELRLDNLYVATDIQEMLELSVRLYRLAELRSEIAYASSVNRA